MIHVRISTDTLMSRRRIRYWSDWQAAAIYGKVIACWIMGAEKGVWTFFCPTRQDVVPSVWNMIAEYMKQSAKTNAMPYRAAGRNSSWGMLRLRCTCRGGQSIFLQSFSVEILRKVLAKIEDSYYENPREIQLFFYYPSDEYISELMTVDMLSFVDEIDCRDLFDGENPRERIMVFAY